MRFSKTFPRSSDKSVYPKWVEVYLTEDEEREAEEFNRQKNIELMKQCLDDARLIVQEKRLLETQEILCNIAIALFERRASHDIFYKESIAKKKFDESEK